jgi:short-subunit dehydrogenase
VPARPLVVITGASAGIGRAIAIEFARSGADVALLARGLERLRAATAEVQALGVTALAIPIDVANAAEVEGAADRIEQQLGAIDVWVNNAMATIFSPLSDITPEEFRRVTEVTYLGTVHGTMAALKRMRPRNRGCIVQVGSALAYRSIPLQSAYCGAKAGVRGFTDSLRSELLHEHSRVRLTMVQLSGFNTPQFDWGRSRLPRRPQPVPPVFQPELAARAVVWAARHRRREVWVGWPAAQSILSTRILPGLGDRLAELLAYERQQTDEPAVRGRADNLFEPVPGLQSAHGRFDERARDHSLQFWLTTHRLQLLATAALVVVVAAAAWWWS